MLFQYVWTMCSAQAVDPHTHHLRHVSLFFFFLELQILLNSFLKYAMNCCQRYPFDCVIELEKFSSCTLAPLNPLTILSLFPPPQHSSQSLVTSFYSLTLEDQIFTSETIQYFSFCAWRVPFILPQKPDFILFYG